MRGFTTIDPWGHFGGPEMSVSFERTLSWYMKKMLWKKMGDDRCSFLRIMCGRLTILNNASYTILYVKKGHANIFSHTNIWYILNLLISIDLSLQLGMRTTPLIHSLTTIRWSKSIQTPKKNRNEYMRRFSFRKLRSSIAIVYNLSDNLLEEPSLILSIYWPWQTKFHEDTYESYKYAYKLKEIYTTRWWTIDPKWTNMS